MEKKSSLSLSQKQMLEWFEPNETKLNCANRLNGLNRLN